MKKTLQYGLILIVSLLVTSCGWQLRGGIDADNLKSIYIHTAMPHGSFTKLLKSDLNNQGVAISGSKSEAQYQLLVISERSDSRTASITSSARAAEQTVVEEVTVAILDGSNGEYLLADTVLRAERSLDFDENQVIGKADELELVQQELQQDLVRQLTRRLQRLSSNR